MSREATVSIVRIDNSVEVAVEEAVNLVGGLSSMVAPGDTVLIKPNCIREEPSYMGTTTNIQVIKAAVRLVKEAGAIPIVGEASGNQYDTEAVFENLGLRACVRSIDLPCYKYS